MAIEGLKTIPQPSGGIEDKIQGATENIALNKFRPFFVLDELMIFGLYIKFIYRSN